MSLVLAIDQGTPSSRAVAFDARARPVAAAQEEFPQHFPQPGWVEHAPQDLWETVARVAARTARQARRHGRIRAVGMGKSKPIVDVNGTVEQQGMNRRVEIKVRPKK